MRGSTVRTSRKVIDPVDSSVQDLECNFIFADNNFV